MVEHGSTPQGAGDLVDFVASVVGEAPLRVEESLGDGFVRLRVSEAERRQAKHDIRCVEDAVVELLRNSRDAGARTVWLATLREGDRRTLVCVDDGSGIPPAMAERVFEARVTSKLDTVSMDRWGVHGRGMALFSIRQNAVEAQVRASGTGLGTSLVAAFDCTELPERADQSTWPQIGRDDQGDPAVVRGPHKIVRAAVEFALERMPAVKVYLGTPTEVLASLVACAARDPDVRAGRYREGDPAVPVWMRPGLAGDARSMAAEAGSLGIDVSERTCYRILNGELEPPSPLAAAVLHANGGPAGPVDLLKDRRGLKVTSDDLRDFSRSLEHAFRTLADRYYLSLAGEPKIRVTRDAVSVTFPIEKEW